MKFSENIKSRKIISGFFLSLTEDRIHLHSKKTVRGGAVVARWAHNPKVIGSNPVPATN